MGSGGHGPADTGLGDWGGAHPGPSAAHLAEGGGPGVELRAGPPAPSPCCTLTAPGRGLVARGSHRPTPRCHSTALLHQCGHGTGWEGAGPSAPRPPATIQEEVREAAAPSGGWGSAAGRWFFLHSESCLRRLPSHQPATTPPSDSQAGGTNARRAHLQPRLLEGLLRPTVRAARRPADPLPFLSACGHMAQSGGRAREATQGGYSWRSLRAAPGLRGPRSSQTSYDNELGEPESCTQDPRSVGILVPWSDTGRRGAHG